MFGGVIGWKELVRSWINIFYLATRKPATRKPATRKPATRKPVTRKPATRKPELTLSSPHETTHTYP